MNGETDVKPQDCKATSSKQEDNHDTATTNNKATNETETLSLQGKITNSSNARGDFLHCNLIFLSLNVLMSVYIINMKLEIHKVTCGFLNANKIRQ